MTDLTHILNWRRINDRLTTSGQPTELQLADIRELGVTHIVNLGPHHNDGALADEAGTVAGLGMTYIYIPVEFEAPTDDDFEAFKRAMDAHPNARMHVHCIYNARVSAFFYRYAKSGGIPSPEEAFANMDSIWRPGKDWAAFIDRPDAEGMPNRYAGEDYEAPDKGR
ncbi:protein tyrosine phosphatase family protein [Tateyamaria sp. syn59]|uniref:protein tyrosine phosphatase family protein n=1 Tax=Tateyamaria sp. syn59 TaxID=2576942 RepID=UPI0011BF739A|nr:protein tyrosine phosphatase family protein [Tateyamaria sp. syn59]